MKRFSAHGLDQVGGGATPSHSQGFLNFIAGDFEDGFDIYSQPVSEAIQSFSVNGIEINSPLQTAVFNRALLSGSSSAFTLAEVLITIGVVGVVAAITVPTLMSNVQDRVKKARIKNIHQKLSKVTDKMAVQSGMTGYGNTMAFVQEMSKHMKIAKICDNNNLGACWPTQEVDLNRNGKTWEMAKTKNASTLRILNEQQNWTSTAGIVTTDGVAMILSYDKTCSFDVNDKGLIYNDDTGKSNSLDCLSGVFDWNGGRNPNRLGDDVTLLGMATGLGSECVIEINGKCVTPMFQPSPLSYSECEAQKDKLGIQSCCPSDKCPNGDYWAGAVAKCGGVDKMPTMADAIKLYQLVKKDGDIYNALEIDRLYYWLGEEMDSNYAYMYYYGHGQEQPWRRSLSWNGMCFK